MSTDALKRLAERWAHARAAERANFQSYLIELCEALGVPRPGPAGSGYQFELPVKVVTREGVEVPNFLDCHRRDFFAIEAKDEEPGKSKEMLLRRAFGQARHYASHAPGGLPPYLIVMDVARSAIIWDAWDGGYGDWQAGRRIDLTRLHERAEDAALFRAIWTDPRSLDPRARAQAVTKEVAGHLAELARSLEGEGYGQERVARFVMRCVFTMFAEDIGLLPGEPFRQVLKRCEDDPGSFPEQASALWKAMDAGKKFDWKQLLRFNGHFFRQSEALPLSRQAILILGLAAEADWQDVEPAIFGTLLTRALDPSERHRLGAEFTPREFVERVVRPAVEEPIREKWKAEQAAVLQLRESSKKKQAEKRLRQFHDWMKSLRFLDPACGSGNFLYVTMHLVKRIELEVLRELEDVTDKHEMLFDEVHPKQFFGIEIKPWAREIAELVLWIGYHQFWKANHTQRPQEPILEDTGTIECGDAVLAWDEIRHDPARDRPDPTPRIRHAVTGKLVPDPKAKLRYMRNMKPRRAQWPKADFVIGNPPYLGKGKQREELGDGYVDALRATYPELPDGIDYVMYWWFRCAQLVGTRRAARCGLITTNSITQKENRQVVAMAGDLGAAIIWAVADHPWADDPQDAAVRVSMTVIGPADSAATLVTVDNAGQETSRTVTERINADLSITADVASASAHALTANQGLCSVGFSLFAKGFVLDRVEADRLLLDSSNRWFVRPYVAATDVTDRGRGQFVIDFALLDLEETSKVPMLVNILRDRVKPERDANRRGAYRDYRWRFGEPRPELRASLAGLPRFMVTPRTAKHRFFTFVDSTKAPDEGLVCVASADSAVLGVLSSSIHVTWILRIGGTLEDRPRYNKSVCFDPFPFPDVPQALRAMIGEKAEKIDTHRKNAVQRDPSVTLTGIYNVVEKLRNDDPLTPKERTIHEIAACGVLKDVHDELDALVARAYGWEWPLTKEVILKRLVELHDERVKEEKAGRVRWLRPEYQVPRFGKDLAVPAPALALSDRASVPTKHGKKPAWPADVISQIGAIKTLLASDALSLKEITACFLGAKSTIVRKHLEILLVMGEVQENPDGKYQGAA